MKHTDLSLEEINIVIKVINEVLDDVINILATKKPVLEEVNEIM